jgi:hypothetical protein
MMPVTNPPPGLAYEMLLNWTPFTDDSTVCCRFSGALTS